MGEARDNIPLLRFWQTPLRDLVRFRVTRRLDWKGVLSRAGLSDHVTQVLGKLVRRTRLWRIEKTQIAHELVAHFEDALANGQSDEEAIDLFGDWRKAASLIRRATKRKRSLLWHAWRWSFWSTAGLLCLYVLIGVYYAVSGERHITTDYAEQLNAEAAAVPEADRAWPVFRGAMASIVHDPAYTAEPELAEATYYDDLAAAPVEGLLGSVWPGDSEWPRVAGFIEAHEADIEQIRVAAGMPGFGYVAGFVHAPEDLVLFNPEGDPAEQADLAAEMEGNASRPVYAILLPHLGYSRVACRLLAAEGLFAVERGDPHLLHANLVAIFQLADHMDEQRTVMNQLVAMSIDMLSYELISRAMDRYPDALTDAQLLDLAHRVAARRVYPFDYATERMNMMDMIQRVYTDDGHGNGRLSPEGWSQYVAVVDDLTYMQNTEIDNQPFSDAMFVITMPGTTMIAVDRRELTQTTGRLFDQFQAQLSVPMHEQPESLADQAVVDLVSGSPLSRARYPIIGELMPALGAVRATSARHTAASDATATALVLELYRRQHGEYPGSLDELVPRYLPEVPIDRMTGGPMLYRIGDQGPVLYSVGADRDDDGGEIVYDEIFTDRREYEVMRWVVPEGETAVDGDWVIWPIHDDVPRHSVYD